MHLGPLSASTRILGCAWLLILGAGACGQTSRENAQPGGAGAPWSAAGNANSAGAGDVAGNANNAGNEAGGASPLSVCELPLANGPCTAAFNRYYYDGNGLCRPFLYGGCDGNENNFETREECEAACPQALPDCEQPTDCQIGGYGCCSACENREGAVLQATDLITYTGSPSFQYDGCLPERDCTCDEPTSEQQVRHFFVPTCDAGKCGIADVRTADVTACETADDCTLRIGTTCCEGCGDGDAVADRLVAVRGDGSFEDFVCGTGERICDDCAAQYPPGARAECVEGRCAVAY